MGRVNTPGLSSNERLSLKQGLKNGESHCFRNRCHVILLKAEGRTSKDTGLITGMSHVSVNHRVNRFKSEGISGLQNKPGQGRKPVLDVEGKKSLLESVKKHRQRMQTAKAEWEASREKSISGSTLRRFLKVLAEDISG
jgi:transposase